MIPRRGWGVIGSGYVPADDLLGRPNRGSGYVIDVQTTLGGALLIAVKWLSGPLADGGPTWHRQGSGELLLRAPKGNREPAGAA